MKKSGRGGDDSFWGYLPDDDTLFTLFSKYDAPQEPKYSGRISTRIAPNIHKQAAELAAEQGISLNQYISDAIVAMNYQLLGIQKTVPVMERAMASYRRKLNAQTAQTVSESRLHTEDVSPETVQAYIQYNFRKPTRGDKK